MKKPFLVLLLGIALGAAYYFYDSRQAHYKPIERTKPSMHQAEVTGEVVDAWCYSSQTMGPGKGIGHRACARACIGGGVTIGILEDGTNELYIAAKYKGFKGCRELLLPYVGDRVVVKGWVGERGGCRLMRIDTVKRLSGPDDILLKYGADGNSSESSGKQPLKENASDNKSKSDNKSESDKMTESGNKPDSVNQTESNGTTESDK